MVISWASFSHFGVAKMSGEGGGLIEDSRTGRFKLFLSVNGQGKHDHMSYDVLGSIVDLPS